jgi:hypothetical protein
MVNIKSPVKISFAFSLKKDNKVYNFYNNLTEIGLVEFLKKIGAKVKLVYYKSQNTLYFVTTEEYENKIRNTLDIANFIKRTNLNVVFSNDVSVFDFIFSDVVFEQKG